MGDRTWRADFVKSRRDRLTIRRLRSLRQSDFPVHHNLAVSVTGIPRFPLARP
jgi:hypothetical protein